MLSERRSTPILFLCLLLLAAGCAQGAGGETEPAEATEATGAADAVETSGGAGPAAPLTRVEITTADEQPAGTIDVEGDEIRVALPGAGSRVLVGRSSSAEKRKYYLEGQGQVAEVKYSEDGFKVRTPDGQLLWKIKHYDDKLKISDNEENQNPYELRYKPDDRVKLERGDRELGQVNFYREEGRIKVKTTDEVDRFESKSGRYSGAYAVLLLDEVGELERHIIVAELLNKGW